jgi:hypothetical protein
LENLKHYWEFIQKYGPFTMAIIFSITLLSLNFYIRARKEVKKMEKYFLKNKTLKGFNIANEYSKISSSGFIAVVDIFDIFKEIYKDENLIKFKVYKNQITYLIALKKFYIISFSSIIILTSLALIINEHLL